MCGATSPGTGDTIYVTDDYEPPADGVNTLVPGIGSTSEDQVTLLPCYRRSTSGGMGMSS